MINSCGRCTTTISSKVVFCHSSTDGRVCLSTNRTRNLENILSKPYPYNTYMLLDLSECMDTNTVSNTCTRCSAMGHTATTSHRSNNDDESVMLN